MKLFGHPDSGHAYKVKFFLEHFECEHDYEVVDIFSPRDLRSMEFLNASKFAEVPLLLDEGTHHIQSNAILIHLSEKLDLFSNGNEKKGCLEWLLWEANKIGMCLPQLRANEIFSAKYPECKLAEGAYEWLCARYSHDINVLDKELSGKSYILGEHISPADFSLSAYLMYGNEANVEIPQNVESWLGRLREINGWQEPRAMLKA